jgi:DNA-binding CsgD family transcriptional regulator
MAAEQQANNQLAELVQRAGLSPRELSIIEWMAEHGNDYQLLARHLGCKLGAAVTARSRIRKKLQAAAATVEAAGRHQAEDARDAASITSERDFYRVLLEAFHNRAPANPQTPAFKNVHRDVSGAMLGDVARVNAGTRALVNPDDLIREQRRRESE